MQNKYKSKSNGLCKESIALALAFAVVAGDWLLWLQGADETNGLNGSKLREEGKAGM